MMTSERNPPTRAFVWFWLPGSRDPVPAGVIEVAGNAGEQAPAHTFAYGRSYLERADAIPLFLPELPLRIGRQEPDPGLRIAGVLRDAGPDAWGQRVIMRRLLGREVRDRDPIEVSLLTYLLQSGTDRAGALDFQESPDRYSPREHSASLTDLHRAADAVATGAELPAALHAALDAGSSLGGARPKATLTEGDRSYIAKFSTPADPYPVVQAEALAMDLARAAGVEVAGCELREVAGRDVLLVERFDRGVGGTRRLFVSVLTILGLDELSGRYATYHDLADVMRQRFVGRTEPLQELFRRIVVNILVGNTDDHARNHAAFWDGESLALTPAYDICPQLRSGQEALQAMAIAPDGDRYAQLTTCLAAAGHYELTDGQARSIIDDAIEAIVTTWHDAADRAKLTLPQRRELWGRQILNPFSTYGYLNRPLSMP